MKCSLLPGRVAWQGLMMLVLLLLTGGLLSPVMAQTDEIRIARSLQASDGTVQVQVVIPRGQSIESAGLQVLSRTVALDVAPVELPVTRWLLLDASDTMINTAPAVSDALERLLLNNPGEDVRTGAIRFDERLDVLQPTDSASLVQDWLDGYTAQAGTPGCISDALSRLRDQELASDRLHRVLIITGGLSRQGLCDDEGYIETGVPLDVLVIADSVNDFYRDVTERSSGQLYQANLQSIRPRLTEVRAQWARPAFALSGTAPTTDEATLQLSLSSGLTIEQTITLDQTAPELDTVAGTGLQTIPTSTPLPTGTPPPSATAQNPAAVTSVSASATPVTDTGATDTTAEMPTTATDTPAENTAVAAGGVSATVTPPLPTATTPPDTPAVAAAATDGPVSPADNSVAAPATPTDDSDSSQLLLLGGGVAAVLVVLVVVLLLLRGRGSQPATDPLTDIEHTLVELEATQVELEDDEPATAAPNDNFYDRPGFAADDDDFDLTEMLEEDEDEFDKTDIVSPEDMLAAANQKIVGELRIPDSDMSYPIQAPATLLGRADECDIVITGDSQISRQHVRFSVEDNGQVVIHPLTSNPVLLDGELLRDSQPLHDGNQLQLSIKLRVTYYAFTPDNTSDSEKSV